MNATSFFHKASYLQYGFIGLSIYFYFPFILSLSEGSPEWDQLNNVLVFMGIAISFSTLQNTKTTQNKISRKIWENPKLGKRFLIFMGIMTATSIALGLVGFFQSPDTTFQNLSMGLLLLGIGFLGMLKTAIEMFENHRLDKKSPSRPT